MLTNIIQPQKISLQTIREEIAKSLNTAVEDILRFEYWQHQLWAHIDGVGGRILSYRSIPTWLHQIIFAIRDCCNLVQLWELGFVIKAEKQRFEPYYGEAYVQQLREIWAQKRDELREPAKIEDPKQAYQKEANQWFKSWQKIINHCQNLTSLQQIYSVMELQSREFTDSREMIESIFAIYQHRSEELDWDNYV